MTPASREHRCVRLGRGCLGETRGVDMGRHRHRELSGTSISGNIGIGQNRWHRAATSYRIVSGTRERFIVSYRIGRLVEWHDIVLYRIVLIGAFHRMVSYRLISCPVQLLRWGLNPLAEFLLLRWGAGSPGQIPTAAAREGLAPRNLHLVAAAAVSPVSAILSIF